MTLQADKLAQWAIPVGRQSYTQKDTILYALGIGCGMDPVNEAELQYVYEDGLKAFPSMAHVLGYPGFWLKDVDPAVGVDWRRLLHGEQTMKLEAPIPPEGSVVGRTRFLGIYDKGAGRDAVLVTQRDIEDAASGKHLGHVTSTLLLRGAGGFGGPAAPASTLKSVPETQPDVTIDLPISPQAALIYRLSGDTNPLHASPKVAKIAGFDRPILHGLCTLGVATRAVVQASGGDPAKLREFGARFSSPVFPGETIRTEVWRDGKGGGSFRCKVLERDVVVLANGSFAA